MTDIDMSRHYGAVRERLWPTPEPAPPCVPPRGAPTRARRVYDDPVGPAIGLGLLPAAFPPAALIVVAETAAQYGVSVVHMLSRRTDRLATLARHALWSRLVERLGMSYAAIGHWLDRDHTTIRHGVIRHRALIAAGEVPYGDQDHVRIDAREALS
jgi:hypothetical protein